MDNIPQLVRADPQDKGPIVYNAERTLFEFHMDDSIVRGVMGPFGSGKSTAMVIELMRRAGQQEPHTDKVRRTRWAIVRNTYGRLLTTTLNTFKDWVPAARIKYSQPIEAHYHEKTKDPDTGEWDGTYTDILFYFIALDREQDRDKLKSLEITGGWINEASEVLKTHLDMMTSRIGRYPAMRMGGYTWKGIIMDTNPPHDRSWWYKLAEIERPPNYKFWKQPGALIRTVHPGGRIEFTANPLCENLGGHKNGHAYWFDQIAGKDPEWIKVHLLGEYGAVFDGVPVYEGSYSDAYNRSDEPIPVYRGLPVWLGFDLGLTPSCVAAQLAPNGRLHILREWQAESAGIQQFVSLVVRPALLNLFPNQTFISTCDPAGAQRSQVDERTCVDELNRLGIQTQVANTNKFLPRREAVLHFLHLMVEGKSGLLLDPSCELLRRGFNGGYRFQRIQVAGTEDRLHERPEKNIYSHGHDALQYLCSRVIQGVETNPRPRHREPVQPSRTSLRGLTRG